jgi:integrase
MASICKRKTGYQAQFRRKGYQPISKVFSSLQEAETWLQAIQSEIEQGTHAFNRQAESTTLLKALERYELEVTPTKKCADIESRRIRRWKSEPIAQRGLSLIRSRDMASYRDRRLKEGAANDTVRQELAVVSHLYTVAIKEWGMETLHHPLRGIRFPKPGKGRDRRILKNEAGKSELDYLLESISNEQLKLVINLAVETAMRRSEILGLAWSQIDLDRRIAKLTDTKNGDNRFVPLTIKAKSLLDPLKPPRLSDQPLITIKPITVTSGFHRALLQGRKRYVQECKQNDMSPDLRFLVGLRFHDLRHEATSRFFEKQLSVMEVASITGHKTLSMLQRYTHLRPENLLIKLG